MPTLTGRPISHLVIPGLALLSWGNKLTKENYDKIQEGMSQPEVYNLLGRPTQKAAYSLNGLSGTQTLWKKSGKTVTILFTDNQVRTKTYIQDDEQPSAQPAK